MLTHIQRCLKSTTGEGNIPAHHRKAKVAMVTESNGDETIV